MADMFSADKLIDILEPHANAKRWLVGFSGGLDSTVLLHALSKLQKVGRWTKPILAVHVHHGLSAQADQWQQHCQNVAAQWQVDFIAQRVAVSQSGGGIEEAARTARYKVFAGLMQPGDLLLLAHQLNDQAETLLFRLLRGTGPHGLAGMLLVRPFAAGLLLRPLLSFSRPQLQDYARVEGLRWIEDDSNANDNFDRNYLRNQVLPLLAKRWPEFEQRWGQTARWCEETNQLTADLAALDLFTCDQRRQRVGWSLSLSALQMLSPARRNNVLRYWFAEHHLSSPEAKHLLEIEQQLLLGDSATAEVSWAEVVLRRLSERLYLLNKKTLEPALANNSNKDGEPLRWTDLSQAIELADGATLEATKVRGAGISVAKIAAGDHVSILVRQGGERCHPADRGHSQTLKKLLQEYSLEPWLRDRVPLLYVGDQLAAVGDLWVCRDFAAQEKDEGWLMRWTYSED